MRIRNHHGAFRCLSLTVASLAVAAALAGCGGGGGGGGTSGGEVQGVVEDSANADSVVSGATVNIGGKTATTDTNGAFDIVGAPLGAYSATVTAPGNTSQVVGFSPSVAPGVTSGIILLLNIGQVRGKVLLTSGGSTSPATNATVADQQTGNSTTVASDGTFLLENLPAGSHTLLLVDGPASTTQNVSVNNGLNDIGTVTLIDNGTGTPPGIPAPTISGTVTLADTSSAAANTVVVLFRNGVQFDSTHTDANGNYSFYAPVGSYVVTANPSSVSLTAYQAGSATETVSDTSKTITAPIALKPNT